MDSRHGGPSNEANATEESSMEADTDITDAEADDDNVSMDNVSLMSYENANWSAASIASSVWGYEYENGRRYHSYKSGSYWGPNDEKQNTHLDLLHHVVRLCLNGELFTAPVHDPAHVLDLGTGTGLWAMDVADMYPSAEVTGIDLSPTQPAWVPPNCRFEMDDIDTKWVRPTNHYSFIHARNLLGAIGDWDDLLEEIYEHLEPSGWVEVTDAEIPWKSDDGSLKPDSYTMRWLENNIEAARLSSKPLCIAQHLKEWLELKGFINVQERILRVPIGPYENDPKLKLIGNTALISLLEGIEGMCLALFTRYLGWTSEEVVAFVEKVKEELTSGEVHCYFNFHFVVGQKPFDSDGSSGYGTYVESIDTERMRSQLEIYRINEEP